MRDFAGVFSIFLVGVIIVSTVEVHAAVTLGDTPWPMFRHDLLHTGRSPYLGAQNFHVKWAFDTGGDGLDSSPAIGANGNVYVHGVGYLYALDLGGVLRWKFNTGSGHIFGCCFGPESSPAIDSNGVVYVGSTDSNLYAILPDGTLNWRFTTGGSINSSPAIGRDGTIYVGSNDHNLYAIAPNGQLVWKFAAGGAVPSSPAIDYFGSSPGQVGTIYVGSNDTSLYAISLSGQLKWALKTGGAIISSPSVGTGGIVYVASRNGYLYAVNRGGNLVWRFLISPNCLAPIPNYNCPNDASPAIGVGGTVYVGAGAGSYGFYAINRNGTLLWKYELPEVRSSAAIGSDGTIYVGVDDPVYAFNPNGTVKWSSGWNFSVGPGFIFYSSPAIGPDGTVYVGTEYQGTLFALL